MKLARRFLLLILAASSCTAAHCARISKITSSGYWAGIGYCHPSLTQDGDKGTSWGTIEDRGSPWIEFQFDPPTRVGSVVLYATPYRLGLNSAHNNVTVVAISAGGEKLLTKQPSWERSLSPSITIDVPPGDAIEILRIQLLDCVDPKRMVGFSEVAILPRGTHDENDRFAYEDDVTKGVKSRQAFYRNEKDKTARVMQELRDKYALSSDPRFSSNMTSTASHIKFTRQMTAVALDRANGCINSVRLRDSRPDCLLGNLSMQLADGTTVDQASVADAFLSVHERPRSVDMTATFTLAGGIPFQEDVRYYKSSGLMILTYRYTGDEPIAVRRLAVLNHIVDPSLANLWQQACDKPSLKSADWPPMATWAARDHGFQIGAADWRDAQGDYASGDRFIMPRKTGAKRSLDVCFVSPVQGAAAALQPGDQFGLFLCLFPTKKPRYEPVLLLNDTATDFGAGAHQWNDDIERYIRAAAAWFPTATFGTGSWMPHWAPVKNPEPIKKFTTFAKSLGMDVYLYNDVRWSGFDACYQGIVSFDDIKDATPSEFGFSVASPGWRLNILNHYRMALDYNQDPDAFYLDSINCTPDLNEVGVSNIEGIQLLLEDLRLLINNYPAPKRRTIIAHNLDQHPAPTAALVDYFLPGEHFANSLQEELAQDHIELVYNQYLDGCGVIAYDADSYKLDSGKFYLGLMRYPVSIMFHYFPFTSENRASFAKISLTQAEQKMFNKLLRPVLEATIGQDVNVVHPVDKDYAQHIKALTGDPWVTAYETADKTILVVTTQPGAYQTSGMLAYKCPGAPAKVKVSNAANEQAVTDGWLRLRYKVDMVPEIIIVQRQ